MRTAGIICEYNPFHAGHEYQFTELRRILGAETQIVCLMSGNYVQRGEPAVYGKYVRAASAVRGGADLVLELPITVSVNAAGYFAFGAVDCLRRLGVVDTLCFGSEGADCGTLRKAAEIMALPAYDPALRKALRNGISYARAREAALTALGGDGQCLRTPNSALGVDYLRRLLETGSEMEPLVIRRTGGHSASALRAELAGGIRTPEAPIHTMEYGEKAMLAVLRTLPDPAFEAMPFGSEGLWRKIMREARRAEDLAGIIRACKSKRYSWSRLRRALLCLFLGISGADFQREIPYLRVLAWNDTGRKILHRAKSASRILLLSGAVPRDAESQAYSALEHRAAALYGLFAETLEPPEQREFPLYICSAARQT